MIKKGNTRTGNGAATIRPVPQSRTHYRDVIWSDKGPKGVVRRALAQALTRYCDTKTLETFSSIPTLAEIAGGVPERTAKRELAALKREGWYTQRPYGKGKGNRLQIRKLAFPPGLDLRDSATVAPSEEAEDSLDSARPAPSSSTEVLDDSARVAPDSSFDSATVAPATNFDGARVAHYPSDPDLIPKKQSFIPQQQRAEDVAPAAAADPGIDSNGEGEQETQPATQVVDPEAGEGQRAEEADSQPADPTVIDEGHQPWPSAIKADAPEPKVDDLASRQSRVQELEDAAREAEYAARHAPPGVAIPPTVEEIESYAQSRLKLEMSRRGFSEPPPDIKAELLNKWRAYAKDVLTKQAQEKANEDVKARLIAAADAARQAAREEREAIEQEEAAADRREEHERLMRANEVLNRTCKDPVHRAIAELYREILPEYPALAEGWNEDYTKLLRKAVPKGGADAVAFCRGLFERVREAPWMMSDIKDLEWLLKHHAGIKRGKYDRIIGHKQQKAFATAQTMKDLASWRPEGMRDSQPPDDYVNGEVVPADDVPKGYYRDRSGTVRSRSTGLELLNPPPAKPPTKFVC